jgi:hypothetical protein
MNGDRAARRVGGGGRLEQGRERQGLLLHLRRLRRRRRVLDPVWFRVGLRRR